MKTIIFLLLISFNVQAQSSTDTTFRFNDLIKIESHKGNRLVDFRYFKLRDHKISLALTFVSGITDGIRDASMFGRIQNGSTWWNSDLKSWTLKYKEGDYRQGPAYFGSTTFSVFTSDAPHFFNSMSMNTNELAKVFMPDMTGLKTWQKIVVFGIYKSVKTIAHNIPYGMIFKQRR